MDKLRLEICSLLAPDECTGKLLTTKISAQYFISKDRTDHPPPSDTAPVSLGNLVSSLKV